MNSDAFLRFISPSHLYFAATIIASMTVIIVMMIYVFLYVKKRRFRIKARVEIMLNEWISDALTEGELAELSMPEDIANYLKKPVIRQFIIDTLININKNVTGSIAANIIKLYLTLELKEDSIRKLRSGVWHKRARGIYELYMMRQASELQDILEYTNSKNEFVRMEAQTAIIGLSGFNGLVFLDTLSYPLYEWQQIKLLEQLNTMDPGNLNRLPLWLTSENNYVVHFALKLAEIYQQFQVHDNVVSCLGSDIEKIRGQAVKTLGSIAMEDTIQILKRQYDEETITNKKIILEQFVVHGSDEDLEFLNARMEEVDDSLKLEAARAIAAISDKAFSDLEYFNSGDGIILSIIKQVKYENVA